MWDWPVFIVVVFVAESSTEATEVVQRQLLQRTFTHHDSRLSISLRFKSFSTTFSFWSFSPSSSSPSFSLFSFSFLVSVFTDYLGITDDCSHQSRFPSQRVFFSWYKENRQKKRKRWNKVCPLGKIYSGFRSNLGAIDGQTRKESSCGRERITLFPDWRGRG